MIATLYFEVHIQIYELSYFSDEPHYFLYTSPQETFVADLIFQSYKMTYQSLQLQELIFYPFYCFLNIQRNH